MTHWIIQHPTNGAFVGWDYNSDMDWVPKYRWSIPLNDPDVQRFYNETAVKAELEKIHQKGKRFLKSFILIRNYSSM